jgi:hypothetical protein
MTNKIKEEHPLGKGEVAGSIPAGSTRKPVENWVFDEWGCPHPAVSGSTQHEQDNSDMGKSADSVHDKFTTDREADEADAWEYWHQRALAAEKRVAELEAERDHWKGLVPRADRAQFPYALKEGE